MKLAVVLQLTPTAEGLVLQVDVKVNASRTSIVGEVEGRLQVALTARPVEGAANRALLALLANTLGVRKSQIRLVGGEHYRRKRIEIRGMSERQIREQCR